MHRELLELLVLIEGGQILLVGTVQYQIADIAIFIQPIFKIGEYIC